ncbi:MAG: zinc ribbon domain-containing protein [Spartobacteria bacterium]
MATYTYETIPREADEPVRTYEIQQSMRDAAFTRHPETGEPIRRVITGGLGIMTSGKNSSSAPAASGGHSCGSGCGCG